MDEGKLKTFLDAAGEPQFRFDQAKKAVYGQLISSWNEATVFPLDLREKLAAKVPMSSLEAVRDVFSSRGDTNKVAFKLADGNLIEAVLMSHYGERNTVCVSSQAGCPMKCSFCATGAMGLKRNLTAEEIVDQVLHFGRVLKARGERVTGMVFMGMGEPMHNYDAVMAAVRILNDQRGFSLGARHISISTCGIVSGINRMAEEELQVNLAISLHAPNDELRTRMMPVNRVYPLAELMASVEAYIQKTKRKVMFEYLLIKGLNDGLETADELAELMTYPLYHVNLIKYHATDASSEASAKDGAMFETSPREQRSAFMDRLIRKGVSVTHRVTFGEDISAACGQLADKRAASEKVPETNG